MLKFRYYFLKENSRIFDSNNLITYLQSNPNITTSESEGNKYFTYHHNQFNFEAMFVLSGKSCVPNMQDLPGNMFDIHFFIEMPQALPNYCVEILLDIVEDICKNERFYIYHPQFKEVIPFRRTTLIRCFAIYKKAYADKFPDDFRNLNRLEAQSLEQIYNYIQSRRKVEMLFEDDKQKPVVSNYSFYKKEGSRTTWVATAWDGESSFILPPAIDILRVSIDRKGEKDIPLNEIMAKAEKLFVNVDAAGLIKKVDVKNAKKLKKIIDKEKFSPKREELIQISLESITDI